MRPGLYPMWVYLSVVARPKATEDIAPQQLEALHVCRLSPLGENPSLPPMGIGKHKEKNRLGLHN